MYTKILAPVDGSAFSECSLDHVKSVAAGPDTAEVTLLRVIEPIHSADLTAYVESGIDTGVLIRKEQSEAEQYVSRLSDELKKTGLKATGVAIVGSAANEILKYAEQHGIDLIVMSSHGRSGINRWFMGSVADKVVRHSPIPVLIVSPPGCRASPKQGTPEK
jgi:nucleotide-binding universal stress UspA family protein